jgi:hypothetical protein
MPSAFVIKTEEPQNNVKEKKQAAEGPLCDPTHINSRSWQVKHKECKQM